MHFIKIIHLIFFHFQALEAETIPFALNPIPNSSTPITVGSYSLQVAHINIPDMFEKILSEPPFWKRDASEHLLKCILRALFGRTPTERFEIFMATYSDYGSVDHFEINSVTARDILNKARLKPNIACTRGESVIAVTAIILPEGSTRHWRVETTFRHALANNWSYPQMPVTNSEDRVTTFMSSLNLPASSCSSQDWDQTVPGILNLMLQHLGITQPIIGYHSDINFTSVNQAMPFGTISKLHRSAQIFILRRILLSALLVLYHIEHSINGFIARCEALLRIWIAWHNSTMAHGTLSLIPESDIVERVLDNMNAIATMGAGERNLWREVLRLLMWGSKSNDSFNKQRINLASQIAKICLKGCLQDNKGKVIQAVGKAVQVEGMRLISVAGATIIDWSEIAYTMADFSLSQVLLVINPLPQPVVPV